MLPSEIGCSGMTCWRRLRDWQAAGVWMRLHRTLLERLADADQLDWSRAALDSSSIAAKKGALPPARTRRIAANRARSAMLWSTGRARHSA
jgi:transposase